MQLKYKYSTLILGTCIVALSACVTKKYERPTLNSEKLYREVNTTDTNSIANLNWKSVFTDQKLQNLIDEALNQNYDLKIAFERLNAAEAILRQTKAAFLPTLQLDASVTDNKQSKSALNLPPTVNINLKTQTYRVQLGSTWEADIWGKLSSAKRSAFAVFLQTEANQRALQTQIIANIANSYFNLLALDQQLKITEKTVEIRRKGVETMKALKESGVVNGAAVVQSEANLYAAELIIPDLNKSIRETENAISVLIAQSPGPIDRTSFNEQKINIDLETGVATQLLKNRPDVQAAEFALMAAFENTNVAKTFFYPSFIITPTMGIATLKLENFFKQSLFYSVIGGITQPILNRGQNKARLKTAQAQQQQAFYAFQQVMLNSGQEVSNSLYAYQVAKEKGNTRNKQIISLTKAVDFTKELLTYSSSTNYTDVLTSEQSLLTAELSGVTDQLQQLQSVVNLYRALGGGWK